MEERCRACVVMGGDVPPCVNEMLLEAEEKEHGHPCPRREWPDREGPILAKLVSLGASRGMGWNTAPLFTELFRIRFGDAPLDYQQRMFYRILAAYQDEQVIAFLFPSSQE